MTDQPDKSAQEQINQVEKDEVESEKIDSFQYVLKAIPITTLIVVFLYVCGIISLTSFWSYFSIDVLSFVSIADVPKYSIYGLIVSQTVSISFIGVTIKIKNRQRLEVKKNMSEIKRSIKENGSQERRSDDYKKVRKSPIVIRIFENDYFFLIMACSLFIALSKSFYSTAMVFYWMLIPVLFALSVLFKITQAGFVIKFFRNRLLGMYVISIMILTPLLCLTTNRIKAINIYNNLDIKLYIPVKKDSNDTTSIKFKLLGYVGDKVIISSMDNKQKRIINQSELIESKLNDSASYRIGY